MRRSRVEPATRRYIARPDKLRHVFSPYCGRAMILHSLLGLLATVGACAVLTACGNGSAPRTTGAAAPSPKLVAAANSPQGVVLALWREIGAGSPTLLSEYDPRVLQMLGTDRLLAIFDSPPPEYSVDPRVVGLDQVAGGILVTLAVPAAVQGHAPRAWFLVAKRQGRWEIRYDSKLADRLRGEVQGEVIRNLTPSLRSAAKAAAAGNRAVIDFRSLFTLGPRRGTLSPRRLATP